ncbi:hypothetical protein GCM10027343_09220 [Noviherbaspirillum agri]
MRLTRRSRFATALLALISVLFMQLAVAAYACPSLQPAEAVETAMQMDMSDHDAQAGCEGVVDEAQPTLCYAHSQVGNQSLDKPAMPDVPQSVAVVLVPAIADLYAAYRPPSVHADAAWLMPDSFPPLSIRNCCFRI